MTVVYVVKVSVVDEELKPVLLGYAVGLHPPLQEVIVTVLVVKEVVR